MLVTTSQSAWSEAADNAAQPAETEGATDNTGAADAGADSTSDAAQDAAEEITEEQALAQLTEYASSSSLKLYVNEQTGTFAVECLGNGEIIWSNPYNADTDPYTKNSQLRAQVKSAMVINSVKVSDTDAPTNLIRSALDGSTTVEKIDNGFKATVTFYDQGITIPYTVTLTDDHYDVSVLVDEIYEAEMDPTAEVGDATRSVVDLGLFPNMNAGYIDEEGYFVIPDGSGAVINFNNGKGSAVKYSQKMYGRDYAISQERAPKRRSRRICRYSASSRRTARCLR